MLLIIPVYKTYILTSILSLQYQILQLEKAEKLIVQKNKDTHFEITGLKFVLGGSMTYLHTVKIYRLPVTGLGEVCYRRASYYPLSVICHPFHPIAMAAKH